MARLVAGEMSSKHITQGLGKYKKGGFYSESIGKPVEGFKEKRA